MAGFEVIIYGRFWVIAEVKETSLLKSAHTVSFALSISS
jgi:hypothetical protein